jgi:hypothetical protein
MGRSTLEFSREHPDTSAGYAAALARLEERLSRAQQIATQQMDGLRDVSAAAALGQALAHFHPYVSLSSVVVAHVHLPRLTAHLTVLDVGLGSPAARIERDGHLLSAVGARNVGLHAPGGGVVGVQIIVVFFGRHVSFSSWPTPRRYRSQSSPRRRYSASCSLTHARNSS